jgi:hypothetical protein
MTVTNRDRDSFKFSATHFMQKMSLNVGNSNTGASNNASMHLNQSNNNGSVSTRNLSLTTLH